MREIRPSGSEGGGPARKAGLPTPILVRHVYLDYPASLFFLP